MVNASNEIDIFKNQILLKRQKTSIFDFVEEIKPFVLEKYEFE